MIAWEHYALALNGFTKHVLRSSRYPLIGLTRNLIFSGKVPFPRAGHICLDHQRGIGKNRTSFIEL